MKKEVAVSSIPSFYRVKTKFPDLSIIDLYGSTGVMTNDGRILLEEDDNSPFWIEYGESGVYQIICNDDDVRHIWLYDAKNKKMILEHGILLKNFSDTYCIKDEKSGKLRLFNDSRYQDHPEEFLQEYDRIEPFSRALIVTKGDKQGIYSTFRGMIIPIQYNYIEKNDSHIMICKNGSSYDFYDQLENMLIGSIRADDVTFLCSMNPNDYTYYEQKKLFSYLQDGRMGVFCLTAIHQPERDRTQWKKKILYEPQFDDVSCIDASCIQLRKGDKVGAIYCSDFDYDDSFANPQFDDVQPLCSFLKILSDGKWSLVDVPKKRNLLTNCESIDSVCGTSSVIFKNDEGFGLFSSSVILDGKQDIEHVGHFIFSVSEKDKDTGKVTKRLYNKDKGFLTDAYQEIVASPRNYNDMDLDTIPLYFAMLQEDGWHLNYMDKLYGCLSYQLESHYWALDKVTFLDDNLISVVPKDSTVQILLDYQGRKIDEINRDTIVHRMDLSPAEVLYYHDNFGYVYHEDLHHFINKGFLFQRPLYTAAYESDLGTVVVNSIHQDKFHDTCQSIESMSDESFNKILTKLYQNSSDIQEKYPKLLVRKK